MGHSAPWQGTSARAGNLERPLGEGRGQGGGPSRTLQRGAWAEKVPEEIKAENFPNLAKDIKLQIPENDQTENKVKPKKSMIRHRGELLRTKKKRKYLKTEMTPYPYKKISLNYSSFLIRNYGCHKEVMQHFSSTKRKLSTHNPISSENILQE